MCRSNTYGRCLNADDVRRPPSPNANAWRFTSFRRAARRCTFGPREICQRSTVKKDRLLGEGVLRVSSSTTRTADLREWTIGWWPGTELNRRHHDFQSCALPTELPGLPKRCRAEDARPRAHGGSRNITRTFLQMVVVIAEVQCPHASNDFRFNNYAHEIDRTLELLYVKDDKCYFILW